MNNAAVEPISYLSLAVAMVPVLPVLWILYRWQLPLRRSIHALLRMLIQLILVGYLLVYLFGLSNSLVVFGLLLLMLSIASWIALNVVSNNSVLLYRDAWLGLAVGGGLTLLIVTQGVLRVDPWYQPSTVIPLAGMVFANAMNSLSLAAERLESEMAAGKAYEVARAKAFSTAMIPVVNSLLAVGVVSLPGMMTGQILSGVSPLIAAQYQIVVMCMIFGSAGLSTALFLGLPGCKQWAVQRQHAAAANLEKR